MSKNCIITTVKSKIKGNATSYVERENEIFIPVSNKFTLSQTRAIAIDKVKKINKEYLSEKFGDVVSLNTSYTDGTGINIHPSKRLVDAYEVKEGNKTLEEINSNRDLEYFNGDEALLEQEQNEDNLIQKELDNLIEQTNNIKENETPASEIKEGVNNKKRKIGTNEFRDTESNNFIETEQNNKYLHQEIKESGGNLLWTSSEGYRYSVNSLQEFRDFTEKDAKSSDFKKENDRMGTLSFRFSPNSSNFDNYLQSSYEEIWKEASKINNLEANIVASTFIAQQISEPTNKFYGRILSRIRESFGVQANGNISLEDDSTYFYVDDKNSISINLYRIGQYMSKFKSFNSFQKDLENTLNEESIHLAINNLATDKEMLQIFEEMTPSQIKDVKEIYKSIESVEKEDDKINLAHEFIRMIIQNKYTGEITESSNPTLFNIINRLLTKVKEWLGAEAIKTNEILNRFDNLVNIKEKNNTYSSITPEVDFNLKATQILSSSKADEVFRKGDKNGWSIDKILTELQVPKEQKQLIKNIYDNKINDILKTLEKNCE